MSTDREKCLEVGCDDYLTKPLDHQQMLLSVDRFASRQRVAQSV